MVATQKVVGHAEVGTGKHGLVVLVILEGPRLPHEAVDDVPVVDRVPTFPRQTRHALDLMLPIVDVDRISIDHHVDPFADQPAGHRIGILENPNRAASLNPDVGDPPAIVELRGR